ncbi:hypothetical protein JVT61DRAFT_6220 [Boletus reticuloceps]|uniref:Uncharacterized protein n=1 Tax=Boletus reticuloceps TaxID=495285 RepID=A0A8I2YKT4_9AGAM|nr:hypothetical protein JVT61DRAFT_6220 [Boletus reticuloceps]
MTTSAPPEIVIPATPSSQDVLCRLFPGVRSPPSLLAPGRVPNSGPEATAALLKALRDNHERSHVFFNEFSFHNHSVHHLLAIYALGAPGPVISAAYEGTHLDHLRVAFVAPDKVTITDDNFADYLGNDQYYNAYLDYFHRVVLEPGATISTILEKYIFSLHYNVRTPQQGAEQPQMLNRLLEILIHPIIHVGYGAEFGILGLIAEGLAWTSVHPAGATTLITRLIFTPTGTMPITDLERQEPEWMPKPGSRLRALNILSLMLRDPRFGSKALDKHEYAAMLESHGEVINKYGEMWDCHIESQEDLEERVEELIWAATLMYGVGSWDGNEAEYRADFFTAHIVTSVLFIPSICAYLSHPSQTKLLRAHFLTSITWWLVRGRCSFALKEFTSQPLPPLPNIPSAKYSNTLPGSQPTLPACALPSPASPYAITPNPWYPILADTLVHPNEHLCKVQRALAHFNVLYGHREAGFVLDSLSKDGVDVDPEYAYLDGTIFLRAAWLTGSALGWVSHGEDNTGIWNYQEFHRAALDELELLRSQGRA